MKSVPQDKTLAARDRLGRLWDEGIASGVSVSGEEAFERIWRSVQNFGTQPAQGATSSTQLQRQITPDAVLRKEGF